MKSLPDLRGFEVARQIESTADRLVILWFSKIDLNVGRWMQVQVTLINARLRMANIKIERTFPKLLSCELLENLDRESRKTELKLAFDPGHLSFECDEVVYCKFARKVRTAQGGGR